jgi:hypothetical protein
MKLSDFSSVLQLGVGLHTGTVLLQAITEFASAPLSKRIERLAKIARLRRERFVREKRNTDAIVAIEAEISDAQSALELKKVHLFFEYKIAALINAIFAFFLYYLLVLAAVAADTEVSPFEATSLASVSIGPALITLIVLTLRWQYHTFRVRATVKKVESRIFTT